MTDSDQAAVELRDAASVFAARKQIDAAIAELASRPLDTATADRMREVLNSEQLRDAREALGRFTAPEPAPVVLHVVPDEEPPR